MIVAEYIVFFFEVLIIACRRLFGCSDSDHEVLLLRKELQILRRVKPRPRLTNLDRFFFLAIFRRSKTLVGKVTIVRPATILKWHQKIVARKWDYSSKSCGRPEINDKLKMLVVEMKTENPRWGYLRIKGELKKLGIKLSKGAIAKILRNSGFAPIKTEIGPTWLEFLRLQSPRYWACDFFTVETLGLKTLYVFFIIDTTSRELIHFGVTPNPTRQWLENVLRCGFIGRDDLPKYFVSDRDGIFGEWLSEFLDSCYHMRLYRTPPRTPNCNAFSERFVLTARSELTDRCLIYSESHLQELMSEYVDYYNQNRPHQSLELNAPLKKVEEPMGQAVHKYKKRKLVRGLVTEFSLAS